MPDLEPVSGDPFATQLVPVTGNPFDVASMTHQAEQPNPAAPYVNAVKSFLQPPDLAPVHLPGTQPKDYLRELSQNPDILARTIDQASNFNFTGTTGPKEITAYHGSPHDFDRFDISKIGTGEGAQSYGHGLYFAENPSIAEHYRDTISDVQGTPVQSLMAQALKGGTREEAIKKFREIAADPGMQRSTSYTPRYTAADYAEAANRLEQGEQHGRMYQVAIKADPEHFLDWDKPLSEQPNIRKALQDNTIWDLKGHTGQSLIDTQTSLARGNPDIADPHARVADRLRSAGIPGIKYLDQGSRFQPQQVEHLKNQVAQLEEMLAKNPGKQDVANALEGRRAELAQMENGQTHNYVVFDDKLIDIMKKYGIAGLAALPAMGAHHFKMQPVDHDPFAEQ